MFRSIIVPIDFSPESDRALPVAVALARRAGLPVSMVAVTKPGVDEQADELLLDLRRAQIYGARTDPMILYADDPAAGIVDHIEAQPDPLLVIGTRARGFVGEQVLGSVSEEVLAANRHPTLVVGPRVSVRPVPPMKTLFVAVDGTAESEAIIPAAVAFIETFGGNPPWVLQMVEPWAPSKTVSGDVAETSYVHRVAQHMGQMGVEAEFDVAHGRRPALALLDMERRTPGSMIALASDRWTDAATGHVVSTARRVTRDSHSPVLIVRAARAAGPRLSEVA